MNSGKKTARPGLEGACNPSATSASKAPQGDQENATDKLVPNLDALTYDFINAHALVRVAYVVLKGCEDGGGDDFATAIINLRHGLDALDAVAECLGKAQLGLLRYRARDAQ